MTSPIPKASHSRHPDYPVDPLFVLRWSPRAFTGEAIVEAELLTIFEAARWAPSSFNSQPWRFLYARRDTRHWQRFLGLLNPFNQSWGNRAAALAVLVSKMTLRGPGADADTPSYAGAAWANLALQAVRSGWAAHAMTGFDIAGAGRDLNVPDGYRVVEAAIAIGRPGHPSILPEGLRAREQPSGRNPLSEMVFEGSFPHLPTATVVT